MESRKIPLGKVNELLGPIEIILESTGVASLEFNLLDALASNGAYVLTGLPGGVRPLQIPGAELIRQLVLDNQVMVGSVNAARDHFQMAIDDQAHAHLLWGSHVAELITNRYPYTAFESVFHQHTLDEIKAVLEWN